MVNDQPHRWATQEDFEKWRDTIVKLYIEEGRGLKDVVDIMENEHGFYATMKMYKYRFDRWDVHKYNKKGSGSPNTDQGKYMVMRGRQGHPATSETTTTATKALKPTHAAIHTLRMRGVRGKRGRPTAIEPARAALVQQRLLTPDSIRLPEEVMQLSNQLASGLVDLGAWTGKVDLSNPESNKWWGKMITATQFLDMGKYKQAFKALNTSFDEFTSLLHNPDPGLLQGAYLIALQLDTQLGQRFLSFASEMADIKLPAQHPLRTILLKLKDADTQQLRHYAHNILESYLSALERQLGASNSGVLLLYENLYDTLDFLSHDKGMHFVNYGMIQERQQNQIQRLEIMGRVPEAQSARMALGFAFMRHDQWEEAEKMTESVLRWLQTHPKSEHSKAMDLWDALYLRFRCAEKTGSVEDVTRVGREYIAVMREELGPDHKRSVAALGHLQKYYRDHGYMKEAEELEPAIIASSDLS
ncbi:hypothetical protein SUNI508_04474 [Seiridium unicorne]|uniref:Clr5 domain-containing protein n=1 Tax=Seiridium unicorne TaxID=138068 RepID=A0ABR2V9M5_9PEZI